MKREARKLLRPTMAIICAMLILTLIEPVKSFGQGLAEQLLPVSGNLVSTEGITPADNLARVTLLREELEAATQAVIDCREHLEKLTVDSAAQAQAIKGIELEVNQHSNVTEYRASWYETRERV